MNGFGRLGLAVVLFMLGCTTLAILSRVIEISEKPAAPWYLMALFFGLLLGCMAIVIGGDE